MKNIDSFTIENHVCSYEDRPLKSKLYFNNQDTNLNVSGYFIEKQFELEKYFLLFISWDCPFEEAYEIIVIGKDFKILGEYSFERSYNSFILSEMSEISKNRYKLVFNKTLAYELYINYPKNNIFNKCINVKELVY